MESGYLWGGTLAGLALLILVGVMLAKNRAEVRAELALHIGERPAQWFVYGIWFVYGYGLLFAVTQAYLPTLENAGVGAPPAALSFLYGVFGRSVLWFFNAAVPVVQIIALVTVGVLLFRHLKRVGPSDGRS